MVIQNAELHQALDPTFKEFLRVMDQPGTSLEKREHLRGLMQELFDAEPQQHWRNEIRDTLSYVFGLFDLVENSDNPAEYDNSLKYVSRKFLNIASHINSIKPSEYD